MNDSWRISLHGGHCGEFCSHARGTLEETVEAAVRAGLSTYGITEHAPRWRESDLYPEEIEAGIDVAALHSSFQTLARERFPEIAARFSDRIELLLGMEIEVVPPGEYATRTQELRERFDIDYIVGSVHHVHGIPIDFTVESWRTAVETSGSVANLIVDYYRTLTEMIEAVRPEVIGHLDLVKLHAGTTPSDPKIEAALEETLSAIVRAGSIVEVNGRALDKGLDELFPSPAILEKARRRDIPMTLGDDAHAPDEVGRHLERGRNALLEAGYSEIAVLVRRPGGLIREWRSL